MNRTDLLALVFLLAWAALAYADHEFWSVTSEKWILEGTGKAERFHAVEACTGLRGTLPYFARVEGAPCERVPSDTCLKDNPSFTGWYIPIPHVVVILPAGNGGTLEHEFIHHLKWVNFGDIDFYHLGPEWACD